jgi:hypothetical protein
MRKLRSSEAVHMLTITNLENSRAEFKIQILTLGSVLYLLTCAVTLTGPLTYERSQSFCSHFTEQQIKAPKRWPRQGIKINRVSSKFFS